MDCVCYLSEDLLNMFRSLKLDVTKKANREIKYNIEGYRSDNHIVMRSDLYKNLSAHTLEFYNSISWDMLLYRMQYQQAMLQRKINIGPDMEQIVAFIYVIRELVKFVIELDRHFSKEIADILGKEIHYTTEDNQYCLNMIKILNHLLSALCIPNDLKTDQTDMSFKVFKNKVNSIQL